MDDILISDQNKDILERLFEEVKIVLPKWGLQQFVQQFLINTILTRNH